MDFHFTPETENKLKDLVEQNGRAMGDERAQDVVEGYFDGLADARKVLSSRYDELKSGSVNPSPVTKLKLTSPTKSEDLSESFLTANKTAVRDWKRAHGLGIE